MFSGALHNRIDDLQLPDSVLECRILFSGRWVGHPAVKTPKGLLEGVVITLAVPPRQVGKAPGSFFKQDTILEQNFTAPVAAADPQLVGALGVPGNGTFCAKYFEEQAIFSSGRNLARRHAAARMLTHCKQDR